MQKDQRIRDAVGRMKQAFNIALWKILRDDTPIVSVECIVDDNAKPVVAYADIEDLRFVQSFMGEWDGTREEDPPPLRVTPLFAEGKKDLTPAEALFIQRHQTAFLITQLADLHKFYQLLDETMREVEETAEGQGERGVTWQIR